MTVYISGPISAYLPACVPIFATAAELLRSRGYSVINPLELPHNHDKQRQSFMLECITCLVNCDAIYILDNYELSKGTRVDIYIARYLELLIFFAQDDTLPLVCPQPSPLP